MACLHASLLAAAVGAAVAAVGGACAEVAADVAQLADDREQMGRPQGLPIAAAAGMQEVAPEVAALHRSLTPQHTQTARFTLQYFHNKLKDVRP